MRKTVLALITAVVFLSWGLSLQTQASSNLPIRVAGWANTSRSLPLQAQTTTPNDPYYSQQWYLKRIQADRAWDITQGGNLVVAVIDTGVDFHHPDLTGKIWVNTGEVLNNGKDDDSNGYIDDYYGYNFIDDIADVDDYYGHGTSIAGIIAARTNNGRGVAGINWNARIMILKALNDSGGGDFGDVARAIRYAVDNGADIINMSFGSATSSAILSNAVNYAIGQGVPMVAAAGNESRSSIFYPAAYPNVIAVGGIDRNDGHPEFANVGSNLDLSAPAVDIITTGMLGGPAGPYVEGSGTSFAAAQVTGAASLILGRYPQTTPSTLESILKTNSDALPVDSPQYFGSGVLNIYKTINSSPVTTSEVSVINGVLPADGINVARVTVTLQDAGGHAKSDQEILVRATGSNTIINEQIVPVSGSLSIGRTNSAGRLTFEVSSTTIGSKELTFIEQPIQTPLKAKATLTFTAPTQPVYSMRWIRQSPYPTVTVGETAELWVEVRNTGNVAWVSHPQASLDSRGQIYLGTDRTRDRTSIFQHDSWLSPNRVNYMAPSVVKPDETARFVFSILATESGNFREYFRPVVEYVTWLNDLGIYWDIEGVPVNGQASSINLNDIDTNPAHYQAVVTSQSSGVTLGPGDTANLSVTLTNVGSAIWYGLGSGSNHFGEVRLGTADGRDRSSPIQYLSWISSNRVINAGFDIAPGERLVLIFKIQGPDAPGVYQENFQLVSEYVTWFGPVFGWTIAVI